MVNCPKCGRVVPSQAKHGLCQACLVELVLEPSMEPPSGEAALPNRVGGYEPVTEIGRGGSGVVFRARRVRTNRFVALKVLLAGGFAGEQARERLRREASVVAGLSHPNIVRVLEVGEQDGTPFLAMDLVEGQDMATLLEDSRPSLEKAAQWVATLAEAVAHAHERGILHRDIKPSNILIDSRGRPHLTDFGLAKPLNGFDYLTLTGYAVGSASYMAPEQAAGENGRLTPAADIYALGAVLYTLLTGRPPFAAGSALATLKRAADRDPVPPRKLNRSVPRDLETICLKCLEKSPERRYGSALELESDLRNYLASRPIAARPPSAVYKLARAARCNPVATSVAILLSIALVISLLIATRAWNRERLFITQTTASQLSFARQQRAAETALRAGETSEALQILTKLVQENPTNNTVRARLFKNLSALLPWPVMPALVHDAPVRYGETSSNRQWLVTASTDGWLHVWNATSAVHHARMPHDAERGRFALSPDGTRVATLHPGGALQVWQIPQGNLEWEPGAPAENTHHISSVEFSADGTLLVSADGGGLVRFWRVGEWVELAGLRHEAPLRGARLNAPGDRLLALREDGLGLWGRESNHWSRLQSWNSDEPSVALFSPAGTDFIFAAGETGYWVDAKSGRIKQTANFKGTVSHACFTSDQRNAVVITDGRNTHLWGKDQAVRDFARRAKERMTSVRLYGSDLMLCADSAGEVCLTSTKTRREVMGRIRHRKAILEASFAGTRNRVLTVSEDGTARVSWVGRPARAETPLMVDGDTSLFDLSSTGDLVATATSKNLVYIFNTRDPRLGREVVTHSATVTALAFHDSGELLASGDEAGRVILTDARTGKLKETLQHTGPVRSLRWHLNRLAITSEDGVAVWECLDGQPTKLALDLPGAVDIDFNPITGRFVVGLKDGIQVFGSSGCSEWTVLVPDAEPARLVRFSPDGDLIASASAEGGARICDATTGQPRTRLICPELKLTCLAFSPDGRFLMMGADNGVLALWDVLRGTLLPNWARGRGDIQSVDFSPDSGSVAFSDELYVYLHDVSSTMPILSADEFRTGPRVRFSRQGRHLLILSGSDGAALQNVPNAPAPAADVVLALAEIQLMQRLGPEGVWHDLTTEEFRERQNILARRKWQLGPEPQARIYR